jgi:hypothetical protein
MNSSKPVTEDIYHTKKIKWFAVVAEDVCSVAVWELPL